jgi:hypothetical protein
LGEQQCSYSIAGGRFLGKDDLNEELAPRDKGPAAARASNIGILLPEYNGRENTPMWSAKN